MRSRWSSEGRVDARGEDRRGKADGGRHGGHGSFGIFRGRRGARFLAFDPRDRRGRFRDPEDRRRRARGRFPRGETPESHGRRFLARTVSDPGGAAAGDRPRVPGAPDELPSVGRRSRAARAGGGVRRERAEPALSDRFHPDRGEEPGRSSTARTGPSWTAGTRSSIPSPRGTTITMPISSKSSPSRSRAGGRTDSSRRRRSSSRICGRPGCSS